VKRQGSATFTSTNLIASDNNASITNKIENDSNNSIKAKGAQLMNFQEEPRALTKSKSAGYLDTNSSHITSPTHEVNYRKVYDNINYYNKLNTIQQILKQISLVILVALCFFKSIRNVKIII
jgi:hypothetical protein